MYFYASFCGRAIGFVISIALIVWGLYKIMRWQKLANYGVKTTGTIVKLTAQGKALIPLVNYETSDGQLIIAEVKHNLILRSNVRQGSQISIRYNPYNPQEAIIISELGGWYYPIALIATGLCLIGYLAINL